jgi:UDP-N-acetylglucosamine acyltransferase
MIDERAIVKKGAKIAHNVAIGPYAIIDEHVTIGEGTWVGPHAVIEGRTTIGKNNKIFQFASIGAAPQDKKFKGESTSLEIGNDNTFREFCSVNVGTQGGGGITRIGNGNLLMNYSHIAHDCIVGDENVFANNATLAGHVIVGNYAILSGFTAISQFCLVGDYCFIGGTTGVIKDILPYIMVVGFKVYGLNSVGLKRHGFTDETIDMLKKAYNIIYKEGLSVQQAIPKLELMLSECPEVQRFIDMLKKSEKGIIR